MAMAPSPRMGRGGGERSEPGVRVPAMPRPSHNEAPLPDWERGAARRRRGEGRTGARDRHLSA